MRHLFVVNPAAGGKNADKDALRAEISSFMTKLGADWEIYTTKAPMDAVSKIRADASLFPDLRVYACGGDGTLNECVNGAAGLPNVAVTHYPCGTGNDFVKTFEADAGKFKSLDALVNGFIRPLDIIDCSGRYCINICSVGVDARIAGDVHKYSSIPVIGGATGYVTSTVVNLIKRINEKYRITVGGAHEDGEYALMCACNGRYYGGGFNPVPEAEPDDGLMDILVVRGLSRLRFLMLVGKYAKGGYAKIPNDIRHIRSDEITLDCEDEAVVNIDGEITRARHISFKLVPGGVRFLFPAGLQFFDR